MDTHDAAALWARRKRPGELTVATVAQGHTNTLHAYITRRLAHESTLDDYAVFRPMAVMRCAEAGQRVAWAHRDLVRYTLYVVRSDPAHCFMVYTRGKHATFFSFYCGRDATYADSRGAVVGTGIHDFVRHITGDDDTRLVRASTLAKRFTQSH